MELQISSYLHMDFDWLHIQILNYENARAPRHLFCTSEAFTLIYFWSFITINAHLKRGENGLDAIDPLGDYVRIDAALCKCIVYTSITIQH